ncbi:MAG: efflux RND transporter periplasmic adaptor subunit [Gemmatimonadales bacterium]|nr:efflux RND transporter periplasmic adaptor subunit [Gemmatimonadales bacterium]NIN13342.1 efflux RND transporter periplasmic adaptor subunit [Gemmatimonadales bacterium]NIN51345.1 efflux RND transporter periplasmic adaptor subunit [Gemmatimonadales bacterium]NIP08809.1 efflux RND transporter periplasmic adaptor subunit [Gemmatimonadales bacterium]NIQ99803.1 efflux RND transporter periplasmic adaptor subunit [Gemmatimonadales bacterium]
MARDSRWRRTESRWGSLGLLVGVLGIATAVVGCSRSEGSEAGSDQVVPDEDPTGARVVNVGVTPVELTSFVDYIRIVGEVEAVHDVTISAEESGTIARFFVEKGARLRQGQRIAKIDDAVLKAQVDEARALAELAREQYERQRRLWEEEKIGSEIAYLQLKSSAEAAAARLEMLQARLARTEIRAPVAGIFDEKSVEAGEMVAPGAPVARVVATRQVKIVGGVPERYALTVNPGDSARITLDVLAGREFVGTIQFVGTSVDPRNREFPIEIVLDNPTGLVKPRMLANVQVERARLDSVVVVPQEVVQRTEDGYQVFVVQNHEGGHSALARSVTLGPSHANQVVIESGLTAGDRLITAGHRLVDDGSLVRVIGTQGAER